MLEQAQISRGRVIEMGWPGENSTNYLLSLKCESEGDPVWHFYAHEGSEPSWNYKCSDVALMHNLVLRECLGGNVEETSAQVSTFAGLVKQEVAEQLTSMTARAAERTQEISTGTASLAGDLSNTQFANLLQYMIMSKATGRLELLTNQASGDIFFIEGAPVHAVSPEYRGDTAILELMMWTAGNFQFYPDERSTEYTVDARLDTLFAQGNAVAELNKYLQNFGLQMGSYLIRKFQQISETDFEQRVSTGTQCDMSRQKEFYRHIDNQRTLFDVLRKLPMTKLEWMPILFNLLHGDLIVLSDKPAHMAKLAPIEAMGLDRGIIQAGMKSLLRPETELINYPLILYFLEQEFFRYEASGSPFSVIIFEMRARLPSGLEPIPISAIREASRRIGLVKRNIDMLAHFETFAFILLLPYTQVMGAYVVAQMVARVLTESPLIPDIDPGQIVLAMGIAGIPEDCAELGVLLSAAKEAETRAKQGASPIVAYRDLGTKV